MICHINEDEIVEINEYVRKDKIRRMLDSLEFANDEQFDEMMELRSNHKEVERQLRLQYAIEGRQQVIDLCREELLGEQSDEDESCEDC